MTEICEMKHIFLTGDIQIGKTTVIEKTLALLNIKFGGFCTYFGADRYAPNHSLYINEASSLRFYDEENSVVRFRGGVPPQPMCERFDNLGARFLKNARENAQLIIMDECGNFEREAFRFQDEILAALEGDTPVLGVLKKTASGFADKIRNHPKVIVITVDELNRDYLPAELYEALRRSLNK
jgi:nucleoside-triphosphatase